MAFLQAINGLRLVLGTLLDVSEEMDLDDIADDEIIDMLKYNKRYLTEGTRMALIDGPGHLWSVAHDFAIPVGEDVLRRALTETRKESKAFMHRRTKA